MTLVSRWGSDDIIRVLHRCSHNELIQMVYWFGAGVVSIIPLSAASVGAVVVDRVYFFTPLQRLENPRPALQFDFHPGAAAFLRIHIEWRVRQIQHMIRRRSTMEAGQHPPTFYEERGVLQEAFNVRHFLQPQAFPWWSRPTRRVFAGDQEFAAAREARRIIGENQYHATVRIVGRSLGASLYVDDSYLHYSASGLGGGQDSSFGERLSQVNMEAHVHAINHQRLMERTQLVWSIYLGWNQGTAGQVQRGRVGPPPQWPEEVPFLRDGGFYHPQPEWNYNPNRGDQANRRQRRQRALYNRVIVRDRVGRGSRRNQVPSVNESSRTRVPGRSFRSFHRGHHTRGQ
jgi:hypothetical protein